MILNDVIPVQHKSIAAAHLFLWQSHSCCKSSLQQKQHNANHTAKAAHMLHFCTVQHAASSCSWTVHDLHTNYVITCAHHDQMSHQLAATRFCTYSHQKQKLRPIPECIHSVPIIGVFWMCCQCFRPLLAIDMLHVECVHEVGCPACHDCVHQLQQDAEQHASLSHGIGQGQYDLSNLLNKSSMTASRPKAPNHMQ